MIRRNDYMLLDLWRRGDRTAGKELFERHFDMLYRFFATQMATGQSKLVVQAFRACLEGRWAIGRHKSFRVHLLAHAHRVLGARYPRHRLSKGARLPDPSEETESSISSGSDAAFDALADSYSQSSVTTSLVASTSESEPRLRALRRLPGEARVLIELHDVERLSEEDIAEILDMRIGAVRRGLAHARGQLDRAMMRDAGEDTSDDATPGGAVSAQPRELVELVLEGEIAQIDPGTRQRILEEAREASGDPELSIASIRPGSVLLELEVTTEAAAMLEMLFESGDLKSLGGLRIRSLKRVPTALPAAPPGQTHESAEAALSHFLVSAFAPDELRRFVRGLPHGARLEAALPGPSASLSHLASEVVSVLVRHDLVGAALFERLEVERPRRCDEIHRIRQSFEDGADAEPSRLS